MRKQEECKKVRYIIKERTVFDVIDTKVDTIQDSLRSKVEAVKLRKKLEEQK